MPTMTSPPRRVQIGAMAVDGDLAGPVPARDIVVFAQGGGSSRRSPPGRRVARTLQAFGFAALLSRARSGVFDGSGPALGGHFLLWLPRWLVVTLVFCVLYFTWR